MPPKTYLPMGMEGVINCPVVARPPLLRVDWTKDGEPLDLSLVRTCQASPCLVKACSSSQRSSCTSDWRSQNDFGHSLAWPPCPLSVLLSRRAEKNDFCKLFVPLSTSKNSLVTTTRGRGSLKRQLSAAHHANAFRTISPSLVFCLFHAEDCGFRKDSRCVAWPHLTTVVIVTIINK